MLRMGEESSVSGFKGTEPLRVSMGSWGELYAGEELTWLCCSLSKELVIEMRGRSPVPGDTRWVCTNEDVFPCCPAQHT